MLFLFLCQLVVEGLIRLFFQICITFSHSQLINQKFDRTLVFFTRLSMPLILLWIDKSDQEIELLIELILIVILLIQLILEIVDSFEQ